MKQMRNLAQLLFAVMLAYNSVLQLTEQWAWFQ